MISRDPVLANYNNGSFEKKLFENGDWEDIVQYGFLNTGNTDTWWNIPQKYTELHMTWEGVTAQIISPAGPPVAALEVGFNNYAFSITGMAHGFYENTGTLSPSQGFYTFGSLGVRVITVVMFSGPTITWNGGGGVGQVYLQNGQGGYYTPAISGYFTDVDTSATDLAQNAYAQYLLSPGLPISSLGIRCVNTNTSVTGGYVNIRGRVA